MASLGSPRATVRFPESQLERLHVAAAEQGATLSDMIRGAVADRLQADGPEQAGDDGEAV